MTEQSKDICSTHGHFTRRRLSHPLLYVPDNRNLTGLGIQQKIRPMSNRVSKMTTCQITVHNLATNTNDIIGKTQSKTN